MKGSKASIRYAKSLLELAVFQNELEVVYEDVNTIFDTLSKNRELKLLLKNPVLKQDKKSAIMAKIFEGHLRPLAVSFVEILILKKREGLLTEICEHFIYMYKKHLNIISAEVKTAIELDEATREKLRAIVAKIDDGNIELHETIDPSIVGGFVVRVGDKQIDQSISSKLNKVEIEFSENPFIVKY